MIDTWCLKARLRFENCQDLFEWYVISHLSNQFASKAWNLRKQLWVIGYGFRQEFPIGAYYSGRLSIRTLDFLEHIEPLSNSSNTHLMFGLSVTTSVAAALYFIYLSVTYQRPLARHEIECHCLNVIGQSYPCKEIFASPSPNLPSVFPHLISAYKLGLAVSTLSAPLHPWPIHYQSFLHSWIKHLVQFFLFLNHLRWFRGIL